MECCRKNNGRREVLSIWYMIQNMEFDPLYVLILKTEDGTEYITHLDPRGNFISVEKRRKRKNMQT